VNQANEGIFPKIDSFVYTTVYTLLLSWEDDDFIPPCSEEIKRLRLVLKERYGFNVEEWKIPSSPRSHIHCQNALAAFVEAHDHRNALLIVYCGGHGAMDRDRNLVLYW
jgi:hypothetical protein